MLKKPTIGIVLDEMSRRRAEGIYALYQRNVCEEG